MKRRSFCLILGLSLIACHRADAQQKKATLDPEEAGIAFDLQGEYLGEFDGEDGKVKVGVQVIALGDGKFRAVGFPGGLPGEGGDAASTVSAEGRLVGEEVRFGAKGLQGVVKKKAGLSIQTEGGTVLGTLKKVTRKSKTLDQKPAQGAVVLFDGTSADAFPGAKLSEDGYLMQGLTSKQKFQGFQMHLEFQLSFMPEARGQGRSNSGVYMQGRYEVQILDSFGLEGKHNECGGIYEIRDPNINMCYPPLSWQTYDVDFTPAKFDADGKKTANARMTVRHNGVIIHDDVEVPKATRAHKLKEGPQPGPIYIQDHGNPVRFRNIWLVEKS